MKVGKTTGLTALYRDRWLALILVLIALSYEAMATVADPADETAVDMPRDRAEVAISAAKRVTTIGTEQASRTAMTVTRSNGLERFLHVYTKAGTLPENHLAQPAAFSTTFGVAPPTADEFPGTLILSATLVDEQTTLSAFSADTSALVEAVAAACVDPVSADGCVGSSALSMRLPQPTGHGNAGIVMTLAVFAAIALFALYRLRRGKGSAANPHHRSRQEKRRDWRGKVRSNAVPKHSARQRLDGVMQGKAAV